MSKESCYINKLLENVKAMTQQQGIFFIYVNNNLYPLQIVLHILTLLPLFCAIWQILKLTRLNREVSEKASSCFAVS